MMPNPSTTTTTTTTSSQQQPQPKPNNHKRTTLTRASTAAKRARTAREVVTLRAAVAALSAVLDAHGDTPECEAVERARYTLAHALGSAERGTYCHW
jgi:hypothetical protein